MARYDFRCPSCGQVREVERSMSDDSPVSCDVCAAALGDDAPTMENITAFSSGHAPPVHFKGDGWFCKGAGSRRWMADMTKQISGRKVGELPRPE